MTHALWCGLCKDWREEPHDCPYVGGVRFVPTRPEIEEPVMPTVEPRKAKWRCSWWHALWIGPCAWVAGRLLFKACFWFWTWWDRT